MRICIPTTDDRGLDARTAPHFGDAPFFVVADVDSAAVDVVRNPECHGRRQSCHHVQLLRAHHVDAVVCEGIGRRALAGLLDAGIDVLASPDPTVAEIVRAVGAGAVRPLTADDARGGGGRHRRRQRHGGHRRV